MIEIFKYATSNFWIFLGCIIIITIPFNFVYRVISRSLKHREIMKHGRPAPKENMSGVDPNENEEE